VSRGRSQLRRDIAILLQPKRFIQFSVGQQSRIGGDLIATKLELSLKSIYCSG